MSICKWKGKLSTGGILCTKSVVNAQITTDDNLVTCKGCMLILGNKIQPFRQTHLASNFFESAYFEDGVLVFSAVSRPELIKTICSTLRFKTVKVTNDPKEITCSHCIKSMWGDKESKKFILRGFMVEGGLTLRNSKERTESMSSERMGLTLDSLLYRKKE